MFHNLTDVPGKPVHALTMKEPPLLYGQDAQVQRLAVSGNALSLLPIHETSSLEVTDK
jgi:hypothetical protein